MMKRNLEPSAGGDLRPPQTPLRILRGQAPSNSPLNYENKKEPQRSYDSFGGSYASRYLIGVEKQKTWYSIKTALWGEGGRWRRRRRRRRRRKNFKSGPAPIPSRPGMEYRVRLPLTPMM